MAAAAQTWEAGYIGKSRWCVHLLPSLTDFAFLLPLFLLFAILPGTSVLLSDGDTGWHIRTGDWILQHKAVPAVDLFSFTKPGQPWFAWEWGWDVLFAAIHKFWGLGGVVFVNVLLLGFISALLFRLIRRCSDSDLMALAFTFLAVCGSMIHWLARPHLVSWLFVVIFLHAIASAERGNFRGLCWLPLLMLAWANLHGGFFVGIALLFAWAIGETLRALLQGGLSWRAVWERSRPYLLSGTACLAVTFINPYGWRLHQHVFAYLRDSKLLDNIREFQSINFHQPGSSFFEGMLLLGVPAAFWCFRRQKIAAGLCILVWAHLSLAFVRNVPLFVLIAAPWVACMSLDVLKQLEAVSWLKKIGATVTEICMEFRPLERVGRCHLTSILALIFVAYSFAAGKPGFAAEFNPEAFPAQAIYALQAAGFSRLFTVDQWGDYLIYRFPTQRVFMDGRSDFYGSEFVECYQRIMSAQYDWEAYLGRFAIDGVMVKPDAPIATALKGSPQWKPLFDDGKVIIFRTTAAAEASHGETRADFRPLTTANGLETLPGTRVNDSRSSLNFDERRSL